MESEQQWLYRKFKFLNACSVCYLENDSNEIDHVDPKQKIRALSDFRFWHRRPVEEYKKELAKCQVLCVHHHREKNGREAKDFTDYKAFVRRRAKKEFFLIQKRARVCCRHCGLRITSDNDGMFDLHHRNPSEKTKACSALIYGSKQRLFEEMEKCDLVCKQCHKEHHATRE